MLTPERLYFQAGLQQLMQDEQAVAAAAMALGGQDFSSVAAAPAHSPPQPPASQAATEATAEAAAEASTKKQHQQIAQ